MKIKKGGSLVVGDALVGIADNFGPRFQRFHGPQETNAIIEVNTRCSKTPERAMWEDGRAPVPARVIRPVTIAEVKAKAAELQFKGILYPGGYWYEVHGD